MLNFLDKRQIAATIISVLLLGLLIYIADVEKFIEALRNLEKRYIVIGLILGVSAIFFRSLVWHEYLNKLQTTLTRYQTFKLFAGGEFLNNITPLGQAGGQPFMAYIISDNTPLEYEKSLTAVVTADLTTGVPLLTLSTAAITYFFATGQIIQEINQVAQIIIALLITTVITLLISYKYSGKLKKLTNKAVITFNPVKKWEQKILNKIENITHSIQNFIEKPRDLLKPLLYGHLAFLTDTLIFYTFLIGLGIQINPLYLLIFFPMASLFKAAPTSGGTGAYEFALAAAVSSLPEISFSIALTTTILYRLATYWQAIIIGYIYFSHLNYKH